MDTNTQNKDEEVESLIASLRSKLARDTELRRQWSEAPLFRQTDRSVAPLGMLHFLSVDPTSAQKLAQERRTTVLQVILSDAEQLGFQRRLHQLHEEIAVDLKRAWSWLSERNRFGDRDDVLKGMVLQVGELKKDHECAFRSEHFEVSFREAKVIFAALFGQMKEKKITPPSIPATNPFHGFQYRSADKEQIHARTFKFPNQITYWPESALGGQRLTGQVVSLSNELEAAVAQVVRQRGRTLYQLDSLYFRNAENLAVHLQQCYGASGPSLNSEIKSLPGKIVELFLAFEPYVEAIKVLTSKCREVADSLSAALDEYDADGEPHGVARSDGPRNGVSDLERFYGAAVLIRAHEQLDRASSLVPLLVNETTVRTAHMHLTTLIDNRIRELLRTRS